MKLSRFSLRGLIVLVTAVGVYLGARDWRKRTVLNLCEDLRETYIVDVPNGWLDAIWQRKPTIGTAYTVEGKERLRYVAGRDTVDAIGVMEDAKGIARLKTLGVVEIDNGANPKNAIILPSKDELERLMRLHEAQYQ